MTKEQATATIAYAVELMRKGDEAEAAMSRALTQGWDNRDHIELAATIWAWTSDQEPEYIEFLMQPSAGLAEPMLVMADAPQDVVEELVAEAQRAWR